MEGEGKERERGGEGEREGGRVRRERGGGRGGGWGERGRKGVKHSKAYPHGMEDRFTHRTTCKNYEPIGIYTLITTSQHKT